jgi:hypothetical protein
VLAAVVGRDERALVAVDFYLRGHRLGTDRRARFGRLVSLRRVPRHATALLRARASTRDGRVVTLDRVVARC